MSIARVRGVGVRGVGVGVRGVGAGVNLNLKLVYCCKLCVEQTHWWEGSPMVEMGGAQQ